MTGMDILALQCWEFPIPLRQSCKAHVELRMFTNACINLLVLSLSFVNTNSS